MERTFDIPTTRDEMIKLGIEQLDVILVTGDAYIDHPSFGVSIIARTLKEISGLSVGVIAQPDWKNTADITRLGTPKYFFGVTSGNVDSMVANYTASKKKRKNDDYTPGGEWGSRPDMATIVYSNLIKSAFKGIPIVLGGVEASLRRLAHYDWWHDRVKKSVLLDSKADLLVYGMGEKTILQIAEIFKNGGNIKDCHKLRGITYWTSKLPEDQNFTYQTLPSFEEVSTDKKQYADAFKIFYYENDALRGKALIQKHDNRYVVQNPPQSPMQTEEMDQVYALNYTRKIHPYYLEKGYVKALSTVKYSITSHRGCYGNCSFCAITLHQGRLIQSRSEESILNEVKLLASEDDFKGYISDIGGPTANMYGHDCIKKLDAGTCREKDCVGMSTCNTLKLSHKKYIELLKKAEKVPGVKKVFVASGVRIDLIYADKEYGIEFLQQLIRRHISGQLKIAPEHASDKVLRLMNKPKFDLTIKFLNDYRKLNKELNSRDYISAYLIAAHPGSTLADEKFMREQIEKYFGFSPEQIQIFTPTPSTRSTTMFYTEFDPMTGEKVFVEKNEKKRKEHKNIILGES